MASWGGLLVNGDWNKHDRKREILSMVRGVTDKRMAKCTAHVPTTFHFGLDDDVVSNVTFVHWLFLFFALCLLSLSVFVEFTECVRC